MGSTCGISKNNVFIARMPQHISVAPIHHYCYEPSSFLNAYDDLENTDSLSTKLNKKYIDWISMGNYKEESITPLPNSEFFSLSEFALKNPQIFAQRLSSGPYTPYRWIAWKTALKTQNIYIPRHYKSLLLRKAESKWFETISADVKRTFTRYQYNHESLENILLAYEIYNPSVGYCQGMNFIAAILLIISEAKEEENVWAFVALMEQKISSDELSLPGINQLYIKDFPLVTLIGNLFNSTLEETNPDLRQHLSKVELQHDLWLTKWISSLFLYTFPFEYCIRFWDALLANGVSFIIPIICAILSNFSEKLLNSNTMENCYGILKFPIKLMDETALNPDEIIRQATEIKVNWEVLDKMVVKHQSDIKREAEKLMRDDKMNAKNRIKLSLNKIRDSGNNDQSTQSTDKGQCSPPTQFLFRYENNSIPNTNCGKKIILPSIHGRKSCNLIISTHIHKKTGSNANKPIYNRASLIKSQKCSIAN